MNPNHLLKEELQYELLVRGINSDSDVHTLRKLFRAVVADKVPCDLRNLTTHSVEELYELVVNIDIGVAGPDCATGGGIDPAGTAFPDASRTSEGTLAAFDGVGHQRIGLHELETSTSTRPARRHRNQPPQDGRGRSYESGK